MYRAVFLHTGLVLGQAESGTKKVLGEINQFLEEAETQRGSFESLYRTLQSQPYGVRAGVIPLLVAYALSRREQLPILYYQNREIVCNGENLVLIEERTKQSYLFCERGSAQKEAYLCALEGLFGEQKDKRDSHARYRHLFEEMQKWYRALPACATGHRFELQEQQTAAFCRLFQRTDGNVRETLMERIPQLFSVTGINEETVEQIEQVKKQLEEFERQLSLTMICWVKKCLGGEKEENLADVLRVWYEKEVGDAHAVYERNTKGLIQYIRELHTYDEEQIMRRLSKIVVGIYLSDWNDGSRNEFEVSFKKIKEEVEEKGQEWNEAPKKDVQMSCQKTQIQLLMENGTSYRKQFQLEKNSDTVYFFKNEMERLIEDYAGSMTAIQQWTAIAEILQKLFIEG